jgi:cytochrome P450
VIGIAAFGTDLGAVEGQRGDYQTLLYNVLEGLVEFSRRPHFTRFWFLRKWLQWKKDRNTLNHINLEILASRRRDKTQGKEFNDFLEILMEPGNNFTDEEITLDVQDLLAAGHETTSNTIAFALYLLAKNPRAQDLLFEETQKHPNTTYEDASKLKMAEAVVKEALRMFPVIPYVLRQSTEATEIKLPQGVVPFPKDARVMFSIYSLGADPRYWKNPSTFDVARWETVTQIESDQSSAYIPFGTGYRSCVGARMAMLEGKMILSQLIHRYHVRMAPGESTLQTESVISLRPKNVQLLFYRRSDT